MGCNKCLQNIGCFFNRDETTTFVFFRITVALLQFFTVVTAKGSLKSLNIGCAEFFKSLCLMGFITTEQQATQRR